MTLEQQLAEDIFKTVSTIDRILAAIKECRTKIAAHSDGDNTLSDIDNILSKIEESV